MIINKVVHGGASVPLPTHKSFGKYVLEKLKNNIVQKENVVLINNDTSHHNTATQILQETINLSSGLKRLGVKRGDVVAIFSENRDEFIVSVIAILCCGATVSTINVLYSKDEIRNALDISKPSLLIGSESALNKNIDCFTTASCIQNIIVFNGTLKESSVQSYSYESIMIKTDINIFEPTVVDGNSDIAFIMYSSGTTGLPKGVVLTHENILYGILIMNTGFRQKHKTKILTVMPWYHVYGLLTTIEFIVNGDCVVYLPEFSSNKYFAAIHQYQAEVLLTVPLIITLLGKSPLIEQYDLSSVQFIWCAAAPLSENIIAKALVHVPNCKGIFQGYGLTESSLFIIKNWPNLKASFQKPTCCGIPLPGVQLKVVDVISRSKLNENKEGEICVKGPMITKGYYNNEAATNATFDEEGYMMTGDIGYYDKDGCIFIVDRLKEIIKYKGHQVPPSCIEYVLLQHIDVAECAVIGAPDEMAGELPTAFVVPREGRNPTEQDLLDFTESKLSTINRLRGGIIFVSEIPKNCSGKFLRRELKKQLEEMHKK